MIINTCSMEAQVAGDGPIILGANERYESLVIKDMRISLDLFGQYRRDEHSPKTGDKVVDEEIIIRETVELDLKGFIGHPNLIEFDLNGKFSLSEEEFESDTIGENEKTLETIIDYDASALILQRSNFPITIYSRRNQTLFDRQFGSTLDNVVWETGARVTFRMPTTPMTLSYFHKDQEQTGLFDDVDFTLVQDTFAGSGQILPGGSHLINWDYTFDMIEEAGALRLPNSFDRHDGYLSHTFEFGEENQHDVRSTLHWIKETGEFALERLRLNESLRLKHTAKFETNYEYMLDHQQRAESNQTLHRALASLRHELYESLVTTATVGASRLEIDEGSFTSDQQFVNFGLQYTKKIPYGQLLATTDLNYNQQKDGERGSTIRITDEPHVFDMTNTIILSRRNIVLGSIVITNAAGIILYRQGSDYTVRDFGERTEIRRIFGGDISGGQSVLVDYEIGPEPGNTTTTTGLGFTARYSIDEGLLSGLSFYMRYLDQNQDRSPDRPFGFPVTDVNDLIFGAEYVLGPFDFLAEHQIRDSTFSPFEATRLEARFVDRLRTTSSLSASAFYREIDHTDADIRNSILNITGRWNERLSDKLNMTVSLTWVDESDSEGSSSQAFEQEFDLRWHYRQTSVYATIRNAFVNSTETDSMFQTFVLGIRREF